MLDFFNGSSLSIKIEDSKPLEKSFIDEVKEYFSSIVSKEVYFHIRFDLDSWSLDISFNDTFFKKDTVIKILDRFNVSSFYFQDVTGKFSENSSYTSYKSYYGLKE